MTPGERVTCGSAIYRDTDEPLGADFWRASLEWTKAARVRNRQRWESHAATRRMVDEHDMIDPEAVLVDLAHLASQLERVDRDIDDLERECGEKLWEIYTATGEPAHA